MKLSPVVRLLVALFLAAILIPSAPAATRRTKPKRRSAAAKSSTRRKPARASSRIAAARTSAVRNVAATSPRPAASSARRPVIRGGPWTEPTYADSTQGDNIDGEDLEIRRAAVAALGPYNGSVVVVDPNTGRILSMVNQKLALGAGFQPCSTIKVSVAMTALSENVITPRDTYQRLGRARMNLTYALARSNNLYFATLGQKLGFERLHRYAQLFGYGERAGLDIAGETPGTYPSAPPRNGGVGMLSSFGEEIRQTPLQLAALMGAIANGGTLYYLQYPHTSAAAHQLTPKVKRHLDIAPFLDGLKPGLKGAVQFGTARRAQQDEPIAGKTGTCTESATHLGWFGSFNDVGDRKLVVVVLLTGGRPAIGPMAAGIAGDVYRRLGEVSHSASAALPASPSLLSIQNCCSR